MSLKTFLVKLSKINAVMIICLLQNQLLLLIQQINIKVGVKLPMNFSNYCFQFMKLLSDHNLTIIQNFGAVKSIKLSELDNTYQAYPLQDMPMFEPPLVFCHTLVSSVCSLELTVLRYLNFLSLNIAI